MPGNRIDRALRLMVTVLLCGTVGCSSTGAPKGWLAPAQQAALDPFGAWIKIEPGIEGPFLAGEFVGVSIDSVFVLGVSGLQGVAKVDIERAKIAHFDSQFDQPGGWVGLWTFSTLSHGWYLVLSAPVWILAGSLSVGAHSRTPLEHYPRDDWESLRFYARFPQGVPEGLRGMDLQEKMTLELPAPLNRNEGSWAPD